MSLHSTPIGPVPEMTTRVARAAFPKGGPWLRLLPAVEVLRRVWVQQFYCLGEAVRWRTAQEGTLSQGVRTFDLRQARYIGQAKTHLQHVATAAAIDLTRIAAWLAGEEPMTTRQSSFVWLMAHPVCA